MKKILSLLLTLSMIIGCSINVFAYSDVESGTTTFTAVELLSALDILNGFEDGSFKPEQIVTRAEMAKIICKMFDMTAISSSTQIFKDVPTEHWAADYINTIAGLGIINGYGDGNYGPEDTVTYEQAIKMIVCALGYEPMAKTKGGYPSGYLTVANSIGLLKNISSSNRGDIAVLVYNALHTPVMEQTSYGTNEAYEPLDGKNGNSYKTLLTSRDIYIAIGVATENSSYTDRVNFVPSKDSKDEEFEKGIKEVFYIGESNILSFIHQEIDAYVIEKDGEYTVITVVASKKGETLTILSDDIKSVTNDEVVYYLDIDNSSKTDTIELDTDVVVELNKNKTTLTTALLNGLNIKGDIEITFVENTGDDKYDAVIMTEYISTTIDLIDLKKEKMMFTTISGTLTFDFDDKDNTYIFIDDKDNELELADFEEDDVVALLFNNSSFSNATYVKIIKLSNSTVVGTVNTVNTDDKSVIINDVEYKVADTNVWNKIKKPGTEGTFYIGLTGKVVAFDGSTAISKYGYILAKGTDGIDNDVIVKMLTSEGVDTYTLRKSDLWSDDLKGSLVEYKLNTSGLITSLTKLVESADVKNNTYNSKTEMLNGEYIEDDTLVFVIETDADDSYVTDFSYFVDEGIYKSALFVEDYEVKAVVVTDSNTTFNNENGFAIATGVSTVMKDNDTYLCVTFLQDEEENTIYIDNTSYNGITIGTVFVYNADSAGFIKNTSKDIAIVTSIDSDNNFTTVDSTLGKFGKDVKMICGTIDNAKRETNSKGEVLTVANGHYVITTEVNRYTYHSDKTRNKIETGDFLAGNADYDNSTPVLLKLIDDEVVDVYTISK